MRKRHMVDISDAAWDKLERLANRLDAAQYVYKGRPRYGKLIELAIEKLEDSTMEWTVEEVWVDGNGEDATEELVDMAFDNDLPPIDEHYTEAAEGWWLANPNITPIQASQAEKDMALYGNAYISADTGAPIKAKNITFKVSAKPIDPDIHVTGVLVDGNTVKIASDLTQALSAPQQHTLTQVLELEALKHLGAGTGPIEVWIQNVPWNKLKLYAKYNTPPDDSWYTVVNDLASKVRAWLLQGNFIGPLAKDLF